MTEIKELFHKFQDLWQAGSDACLNLECHAGQVWMKFQVKVCHPPPPKHRRSSRQGPSRLRRRARRADERAASAQVAEKVPTKEVAAQATPTPPHQHHVAVQATPSPPHQHHVAVQAAPPPRHQHNVAVQAAPPQRHQHHVAVQAVPVPLLHRQQQAVAVRASPQQQVLHSQHTVYDALCPDDEYLPGLGQLPRVTASRDRLDRDRERKKDLENFTKLLEDSLK